MMTQFTVQVLDVFAPWGPSQHMKIRRLDGRDGITWDELQALKHEYLGDDCTAIEFFPPLSETVDELNMRHLWTVPGEWLPMSNTG
jgi:hypothetical protein